MKYGIIDIGSNSVRLMVAQDGKTIFKRVTVTKLADKLSLTGNLNDQAIQRTAKAVSDFYFYAKSLEINEIYAFATAAVRQAENREQFLLAVNRLCGLKIHIIAEQNEAYLGAIGALGKNDGGVIDVGGASSEIIVMQSGEIIYAKSLNVGAVKLTDSFNDNLSKLNAFLDLKLKEFGDIPKINFFGIGGTATTISAILQELCPYDPNKTHGYFVGYKQIKALSTRLINMTIDERKQLKGLQPERAEIIASGCVLLTKILEYIGVDGFTVSEADNLEGYYLTVVKK